MSLIKLNDNKATELLSTAQNFTGSWVDVNDVIDVKDVNVLGAWLDIDINDGSDVRFRLVGLMEDDATDEYPLPIKTVSASDVKVEDHYYELNVDSDQKVILDFEISDLIPFVKLQMQAGTPGASPAQLESCYLTKRTRIA